MAIIFDTKKGKKAKAANDHMYSGFWLDKDATSLGDFYTSKTSDTVKALKLRKYQRAISNFVKILSQRDVPVLFKGTESYTNNEYVVLATDISDKNFDVYAGLALHEASHLKYTDFTVLEKLFAFHGHNEKTQRIKEILNYVEDRRIDSLVFKSSPGYKAYYHKLYDHYFRTKEMGKALKHYKKVEFESYMTQLIGMLHPQFNANALPGLIDIARTLDINNISRLKSTEEALEVATKIYDIIIANLEPETATKQEQEEEQESTSLQNGNGSDEEREEEGQGSGDSEQSEEEEEEEPMTAKEMAEMQEALEQARKLINGEVDKKQGNRSMINKLKDLQDAPIDFLPVGQEFGKNGYDCIISEPYKLQGTIAEWHEITGKLWSERTKEERDRESQIKQMLPNTFGRGCTSQSQYVLEGLQLGAILGRKLLTRREEKSLEQNRLRSGKIDSKRIAHAGYGIETIFNQIHIDKYKQANIHLSLDASGSMGGSRWYNSIKLAAALGKAVSMIDGLELQISTRDTDGKSPVATIVYDSRYNKLPFLSTVLNSITSNSMTPEGLCFEALINKKLLIPSTSERDSYLINICDGDPNHERYYGYAARKHTNKQVKRMNNELGIKHIGYYFGSENTDGYRNFVEMYGAKESKAMADASNAMQIADHMNKQLMSK